MLRLVRFTIALLAPILAIAGTAAAQPGVTAPRQAEPAQPQAEPNSAVLDPGQVQPALAQPSPDDRRSESVALGLSVGGTIASWTMLGIGLATYSYDSPHHKAEAAVAWTGILGAVLTPSLGHWYAGRVGTRGLGLRLAGVGFGVLAILSVIRLCEDECSMAIPGALLFTGVGFGIAGTIDDIATAPRAVRRYNQRQHSTSIVPVVHRDGGM